MDARLLCLCETELENVPQYKSLLFIAVLCNPSLTPCEDDEFDCRCGKNVFRESFHDPACIPKRWRCDGQADCADGRDEEQCICSSDQLQCGCERGGACEFRYQCINKTKECDGIQDCESYRDERVNECPFPCKDEDMEEIRIGLVCDGRGDCPNFRDEENCTKAPDGLPNRCDCNEIGNFTCGQNFLTFFSIEGNSKFYQYYLNVVQKFIVSSFCWVNTFSCKAKAIF